MASNSIERSTATQQRYVERACKAKDPMEEHKAMLQYHAPSGAVYSVYCRTKADMEPKVLKWAFKLAERNVSTFYKELSMGWQPKIKQNDLNKNWARYLVAQEDGKAVAYAMFRFDMDYGQCVLYCYELQIEQASQQKGLGKFLMHMLEVCARYWHMEKVVLTVLNNNAGARRFFKTIGYELDDTSPSVFEKAEYEILSKRIEG